ncbi:hypothetical protein AQV86_02500 [Nanohaloarchaea archaeon SG9]|nr:hypothetical protein AQV86_02500 [Nanohaloarchaea archaeon SG9]
MKTKILILITALALLTGAASAEKKFLVDATFYDNESAKINNVKILDATRTTALRHVGANFSIKALSTDKKTEIDGKVPISFTNHVRTSEGGYETEKEEIQKNLFLEYQKNITEIKIFYEDEEKASYNLKDNLCCDFDNTCTSYCDGKEVDVDCTCGDEICQKSTNEQELCPEDCSQPESSENTESSTEDQTKEVVDSDYSNYLLIAIVIAAVLIGLFLLSGKVKIEA